MKFYDTRYSIFLYSLKPTLGSLSQESKPDKKKISEVLDNTIQYNLQKCNIQHGTSKTAKKHKKTIKAR